MSISSEFEGGKGGAVQQEGVQLSWSAGREEEEKRTEESASECATSKGSPPPTDPPEQPPRGHRHHLQHQGIQRHFRSTLVEEANKNFKVANQESGQLGTFI